MIAKLNIIFATTVSHLKRALTVPSHLLVQHLLLIANLRVLLAQLPSISMRALVSARPAQLVTSALVMIQSSSALPTLIVQLTLTRHSHAQTVENQAWLLRVWQTVPMRDSRAVQTTHSPKTAAVLILIAMTDTTAQVMTSRTRALLVSTVRGTSTCNQLLALRASPQKLYQEMLKIALNHARLATTSVGEHANHALKTLSVLNFQSKLRAQMV